MSNRTRLLLGSALMLFLELALIRWTGANVVHLSFFSNFVLLGSFLGIGLGFLLARPDRPARPYYSLIALLGLVAFILTNPVTIDRASSDVIFFTSLETTGPKPWLSLSLIFITVAVIMAGPGEIVGSCFHHLPRLEAYRLDLIGSLCGIVGFTLLSFAQAPSVVWGAIAATLYVVLLGRPGRGVAAATTAGLVAASLGLVALLADETFVKPRDTGESVSWSPYYKVTTYDRDEGETSSLMVRVNGIPHQRVTTAEAREQQEPQYVTAYQRLVTNPLDNVLIVGAGTGTDVAIALRKGAKHVDAVEIDPALLQLGRDRNPDHAYQDPRVTTHVDDGRAFLERTDTNYDLILFALPDSLTLVSGASSLRLESYLFTEQAFQAARDHLKPGGAFAMYNFYREGWLVDRLAGTLEQAFGHAPCVDANPQYGQQAVMVAGLTQADQVCATTWIRTSAAPDPSTDDRPFLYVKDSSIKNLSLYWRTLALILLVSVVSVILLLWVRGLGRGGAGRGVPGGSPLRRMLRYRDLFLLGAAFLLLETKSVTGFALLFGTTWVVNALVFGGVLVAVLAAVEVTRRRSTPSLPVMYAILFGGLVLAWLVPSSWLLSLPVGPRALAAITIAFLPIFAANVIFAKRFAETADPTIAFATNLLGAMVGGCLEYAALLFGYHVLLVLAGALYLGAYLLRPRTPQAEPQPAAPVAEPAPDSTAEVPA
ncbi:MAG: methyltransferase domain-containing protein [Sporichthyaceae bacterium]|nr:methyltransferase domain-containing protein [Sporichthyaceae bacterium]